MAVRVGEDAQGSTRENRVVRRNRVDRRTEPKVREELDDLSSNPLRTYVALTSSLTGISLTILRVRNSTRA